MEELSVELRISASLAWPGNEEDFQMFSFPFLNKYIAVLVDLVSSAIFQGKFVQFILQYVIISFVQSCFKASQKFS